MMKDSSQRTIKRMQFLTGESYPFYIYYLRIENSQYLYETHHLITLKRGEEPIADYSVLGESLRVDRCFRPFLSHFAIIQLYKLEVTYASSTGKIARKIAKMLRSF